MILVLIHDAVVDKLIEKFMNSEYAKCKMLRISDQKELTLREPIP